MMLPLVEDKAVLQMELEDALTDAGYPYVDVMTGSQAIEQLDQDAVRFKGVLTGIRLGKGPNGWDVGHHARELAPAIPIVYMSGTSASEWSAKGVPNSVMIAKPYATTQIINAISQLINAAGTARAAARGS